MSTEFVALVPPPGKALDDYDRFKPPSQQPSTIPAGFLDAMSVRAEVFVEEQEYPLQGEFDADDARSWHWVAYASVGNTAAPEQPDGTLSPTSTRNGKEQDRKASAARVPVATCRIVPPPHGAHPTPGSKMNPDMTTGEEEWVEPTEEETRQQQRAIQEALAQAGQEGKAAHVDEPYVKLGRVATSKPFRGLGLSKLVIAAALTWARDHPQDIMPPLGAADREAARLAEEKGDGLDGKPVEGWQGAEEGWRGLVLTHAQIHLEKMYGKVGFARDYTLGTWWEGGIEHVGLWQKLKVKEEPTVGI